MRNLDPTVRIGVVVCVQLQEGCGLPISDDQFDRRDVSLGNIYHDSVIRTSATLGSANCGGALVCRFPKPAWDPHSAGPTTFVVSSVDSSSTEDGRNRDANAFMVKMGEDDAWLAYLAKHLAWLLEGKDDR
jgi:hypothetical protein